MENFYESYLKDEQKDIKQESSCNNYSQSICVVDRKVSSDSAPSAKADRTLFGNSSKGYNDGNCLDKKYPNTHHLLKNIRIVKRNPSLQKDNYIKQETLQEIESENTNNLNKLTENDNTLQNNTYKNSIENSFDEGVPEWVLQSKNWPKIAPKTKLTKEEQNQIKIYQNMSIYQKIYKGKKIAQHKNIIGKPNEKIQILCKNFTTELKKRKYIIELFNQDGNVWNYDNRGYLYCAQFNENLERKQRKRDLLEEEELNEMKRNLEMQERMINEERLAFYKEYS